MAKKRHYARVKQPWYKKWGFWAIVGVITVAVVALGIWRQNASPPLPANYVVGGVTDCLVRPAFTADLGLESPAIDTSQVIAKGLVIREPFENGRYYQHETWDDAGNVGPFAYDSQGDIYIGPTPLASLQTNPTAEQNWIYRVDSQTAVMEKYIELPWALPPSGANPFGIIGLGYDCDTESLYAATVAGSTALEEVGGIYQVDLKTGGIISQLDNTDAIGLGIFNGTSGKRLYYGSARSPEVYSVSLNAGTGEIYGEPRFEFSLAAQPGGSFDNANRIQFTDDGKMVVKGNEFSYSLQVASDPQRNIYTFRHEPSDDSWEFLNVEQQ